MSQISFRTLRQRTRQQATVRRSPRRTPSQPVGPPSILRRDGQQRNNNRRVMYGSAVSPHSSSGECAGGVRGRSAGAGVTSLEQEAQEEEECVQFEDAGHVPKESVEQRKRTPMGREVAALSGNLGVYCSAPFGRQSNRSASSLPSRRAFVSFNPFIFMCFDVLQSFHIFFLAFFGSVGPTLSIVSGLYVAMGIRTSSLLRSSGN
jgi:hypothetical protein